MIIGQRPNEFERKPENSKCLNCKQKFKPKRWWSKFCNSKCKSEYWNEKYKEEKESKK